MEVSPEYLVEIKGSPEFLCTEEYFFYILFMEIKVSSEFYMKKFVCRNKKFLRNSLGILKVPERFM